MPRIAEESVQRVAEANDIVEVIGSYFPLKRAGSSYKAVCPFHHEKTPSFHVSPQKQAFHCFGCGAGGGVFKFVMDYERVDFATAVRRLAARAGIPVVEEASAPGQEAAAHLRQRLFSLHAFAAEWFHRRLMRSPEAGAARDYLKTRSLPAEIARRWKLGYAPAPPQIFLRAAQEAGYTAAELTASGLCGGDTGDLWCRFRDRLMFPIHNDYGEVVAFSGRILPPSEDPAKYVNSPETPLFSKGRILFGLDKARRELARTDTAIVCEGQLDVIRVSEGGFGNVVAPQGTAFTPEQARLLRRHAGTAILCFDADRAGQLATERSLPILLQAGFQVRVARIPPGEDPDSLLRREGPGAFADLLAQAPDYFDHAVDRAFADGPPPPQEQAALVRRLAASVAILPGAAEREALAGRLSARLGLSSAAFLQSMPRRAPSSGPEEAEAMDPARAAVTHPSPTVTVLLQAALADPQARQWMQEEEAVQAVADEEGASLLQACLQEDFDPADQGALNAFMAGLPPGDQAALAAILVGKLPPNGLQAARESLLNLRRGALQRELESVAAHLRQPGLPAAEEQALLGRMVDIQRKLKYYRGSH